MASRSQRLKKNASINKSVKKLTHGNGISWFIKDSDTKHVSALLNFLTDKVKLHGSRSGSLDSTSLTQFEVMVIEVIPHIKDPELIRTLKECGWTGTRFEALQNGKWDIDYVIQMLSNYYLKSRASHTQSNYNMNTLNSVSNRQIQQRNAIDNIMPFCPDVVVDMIMDKNCQIKKPFAYVFDGVCLLADISGFSKYSGEMCSKGVSGLDELRSVTNGLLDNFVETVYRFGGDVIAFAGDALVCVFRDEQCTGSREHCTERALKCANLLCKDDSHHLPTHAAVSYGSLSIALLGGLHEHWVYILTGECVNELSDCINNTKKKEVAATHKCLEVLRQHVPDTSTVFTITDVEGFALSIVDYSETSAVLEVDRMSESMFKGMGLSPVAAKSSSYDYEDLKVEMSDSRDEEPTRKPMSMNLVPTLLKFVPRPVKHALRSDMLDRIGELRQVTTLFLSLDSFSKHNEGRNPLLLQPFFSKAQKHLDTSGGYLRQFLVDDKGCVLIAMWGVPSFTYANNCSRALYFAVSLLHSAEDLGHKVSIGITTGLVFCGCVGSSQRRDYVGIGTDVNIAARLMSKAKGKILIDGTTYQNANQATKVLLKAYEPLLLKGLSEPMIPFIYNSEDIPPLSEPDNLDSNYLLQRRATEMLDSHLDHISNAEVEDIMQNLDAPEREIDLPKSIIFVLGPAGCGKSMAMKYFRQGAQKRGMKSVVIQVQSFHKGAPYSVARMLFMELINAGNAYEQQKESVKALIQLGFPAFTDIEVDLAYLALAKLLGRSWQTPNAGGFGTGGISSSISNVNESICMLNDYTQQHHENSTFEYSKSPSSHNLYVSSSTTAGGRGRLYSGDNNYVEQSGESPGPVRKDLATLMGNTANSSRVANRMTGEQVLVKLLTLLLGMDHDIYALILENGHLCDESSWKLINAVFNEQKLSCVMLVTILVKVNVSKKNNQDLYFNEKTKRTTLHENNIRDVDELLDNISKSTTSLSRNQTQNGFTEDPDRLSILVPIQKGVSSSNCIPPPTPTGPGGAGNTRNRITRKLESELPATCLALMSKKFSDVLELSGLNYDEVADILNASLNVQTVSTHLVQMVLDVSNGNPFWCKNIASFIKEHGLAQLEEACEKSAQNSQEILKTLVMCRVDHLTVDEQMVLKIAAIIGADFSYKLLLSITPHHIYKQLNKVVGRLVEQGFIRCVTEIPELRFAFTNPTFQAILYDLSPPRDAAQVHQAIADYIEVTYSDILQPFYPTLSYHYKLSPSYLQDMAFKYTLKSADQAIAQGAFGDGLYFSQDAASLATNDAEFRILQEVVRAGVEDLTWNQSQHTPRSNAKLVKRTSIYNSSSEAKLIRDYTDLLVEVENKLKNLGMSEEDKKKALLMKNKSTMLTWQVSYAQAPSRQNRMSMQSSQLANISGKAKTRNVSWFGFNKSSSSNSADDSTRLPTKSREGGDEEDADGNGGGRSPSRIPLKRSLSSSAGEDSSYGNGAKYDCCVIV